MGIWIHPSPTAAFRQRSAQGTAYAHWIAVYTLANSRVSRSARSARRPTAMSETGIRAEAALRAFSLTFPVTQ
jgi:hypothetical protein